MAFVGCCDALRMRPGSATTSGERMMAQDGREELLVTDDDSQNTAADGSLNNAVKQQRDLPSSHIYLWNKCSDICAFGYFVAVSQR